MENRTDAVEKSNWNSTDISVVNTGNSVNLLSQSLGNAIYIAGIILCSVAVLVLSVSKSNRKMVPDFLLRCLGWSDLLSVSLAAFVYWYNIAAPYDANRRVYC